VDFSKPKTYPVELATNTSSSILQYFGASRKTWDFWRDGKIKEGNLEAAFSKVAISHFGF